MDCLICREKLMNRLLRLENFLKLLLCLFFKKRDMAVSFRSASNKISDANVVKANAMVQIAINNALTFDAPKYNS